MERKRVINQKELDALIASGYAGEIVISNTTEEINIDENGKAKIDVSGYGRVGSVSGNGHVGSVSDNGHVGSVSGYGRVGSVSGNGRVGSVSGNGHVGSVSGNGQVGYVSGNGRVGYVSGNGRVGYVSGNGQVGYVYDNGQINIFSETVKIQSASGSAILICHVKPKIFKKSKTVQVVTVKKSKSKFSLTEFITRYAVENDGKYLILYKSVNPDNRDFQTGEIKYEIGKVIECPDWDDDFEEECGKGLHLAATPFFALNFHDGKLLKCRVKIKDCRTVANPTYPIKVRCKQVEVIEEYKGII